MNSYTPFKFMLIRFFLKMKYSPRRSKNIGLTDGEGVERLWSFMRRFAKMTKEMSIDKRTDVLTDAAVHYELILFLLVES